MDILRHAQFLRHAKYGLGVVTESNAERTTIDFEGHGLKKFVTRLMEAELLPGSPPARPVQPKSSARRSPRRGVKPSAQGIG
jgi:hypothetical protein